MPTTGQIFGPIYQQVVLDASGNGTAFFQAVGGAKRITNVSVKVSTQVLQATAVLYRGQVADVNRLYTIISGSTGSSAQGQIDLQDGEFLYVRWTGGDAGATATVTFSGTAISFSEIGSATIHGDDPIAAGDGSLIFPALKSPNYVPGVSGWYIGRDGTTEFQNGTYRGILQSTNYIAGVQGWQLDGVTLGTPINFYGSGFYFQNGTTDNLIVNSTGFLQLNGLLLNQYGVDAGQGRVTEAGTSVAIGGITATTVVVTLPSVTYRAGRAYAVIITGTGGSVAATLTMRLQKTNAGGAVLDISRFIGNALAALEMGWEAQFYVSGSNVTASLVITAQSGGGAMTVQAGYAARVIDIGPSTAISTYKTQLT